VLARLSVLCAFLAVIMVVAGCGGGGSSSVEASSGNPPGESLGHPKEVFIAEADAVCADYQAKRKPIEGEIEAIEGSANPESPKNLVALGGLLHKAIEAAEVELESLRELQPPQADEATVEKMLGTAEEGNGLGAEAADALEEGELPRFGELGKEVQAVNNRAKGIAEGYGLKVCGQAP
jgi:hypothetical protein